MATQDFKSQILKCLVSSDAFKNNMSPVRKELNAQKKDTIKIFLDTISLIISNKSEVATTRFYALYFLKTATEHSNPMLVSYLFARTELLKVLEEQAAFDKDKKFPNRGSTFFSAHPSEAEKSTGNNYIALLLEMIKYWDKRYGATDKEKDNPPRSLYKRLLVVQRVPFPEKFFYYKQLAQNQEQKTGIPQVQKSAEKTMTQSEKLEPKRTEKKPEKMVQSSNEGITQQQTNMQEPAPVNETNSGKPAENKTPVNKNVDNFQEIKKKFDALKNVKVELLQIYETHEAPCESGVLKFYYDDLVALHKQLSELLTNFFNSGASTKDEIFVAELLRLNDQVDLLSQTFNKYSAGTLKWTEHRQEVLNIIQADKTNISTPGNQQEQQKKQNAEDSKILKSQSVKSQNAAVSTIQKQDTSSKQTDSNRAQKKNEDYDEEEKVSKKKDLKTTKRLSKGVGVRSQYVAGKGKIYKAQNQEGEGEENEEWEEDSLTFEAKKELLNQARKMVKTIVCNNASELYEDADHPDPREEQKQKADEELRQKQENLKEEQRLKTKKEEEAKKINDEKANEEQRLNAEKAKKEQRLIEEKAKEEKAKEEKAKEEKAKEEKAKEEQRLNEEKAKEVQRSKEEKAKEQEKKAGLGTSGKSTNEKEVKQDTSDSGQSQRMTGNLAKSMGLDQSIVAQKFAEELKLMSQSIKSARKHSDDMDKIKESIKQSFVNRNKKPPGYKEVPNKSLLKNLEEQLEKLKTERQSIVLEGRASLTDSKVGTSSPAKLQESVVLTKIQNPEVQAQVLQLQKQLENYQADSETLRKKNKELETTLKTVQTQLSKTKSQEIINPQKPDEIQLIKRNNQELQEKVKKLESLVNKLHTNPQLLDKSITQAVQENSTTKEQLDQIADKKELNPQSINRLQNDSPEEKVKHAYSPNNHLHYDEEEKITDQQTDSKMAIQRKTTVKTENSAAFYPKSLKNDSPECETSRIRENQQFFLARNSHDNINVPKPVRNIFGKTLQLMISGSERQSEISNGTQGPAYGMPEKTLFKRENYDSKSNKGLTIQDMPVDSARAHMLSQSPSSQNSDFANKLNKRTIFTSSPRSEAFVSPGSFSRNEQKYYGKAYDHQAFDNGIHQDSYRIKGDLIPSEIYALKGLQSIIVDSGSDDSLHKFKISCLRAKSLLYENDFIQVGITTNIMQDYASSRNLLKAMVYFGNKLGSEITKFKVSIVESLNLKVVLKPQEVDSVIASGKQVKQQYLISYTGTPFGYLRVICEGQFNGKHEAFPIYLPNVITKYMQFKYIEPVDFKTKWKNPSLKILRTQAITLDAKLVDHLFDFKKYFGELVELRPKSENQSHAKTGRLKLAGAFELDIPQVEYLLKITSLPSGQVVFQIAADRMHYDVACYLLQTLIFIFRQ